MVAEGAGIVGVDLQDHDIRRFDHLHLIGVGAGERDVAVLVRHGGDAHIEAGLFVIEALGAGKVQVVWHKAGSAEFVNLARRRGIKPGIMQEALDIGGV